MEKKRHVSKVTVGELIRRREAREPGFKVRVDEKVAQLAIARQVRALRERRNLSQAELASLAGTGQAAIARIESGRRVPKFELLSRIADALHARVMLKLEDSRA